MTKTLVNEFRRPHQVLSSNSESNVVARSASSSAKNSGSRIELIAAVGHRYGHVCLQAFFVFHESIERTQTEKALLLQGFQKMRGPFFDKNVRKTDLVQPAGELPGWTSFEAVKASIDRWMDYYNNERCQWDPAKLSPNEYYNYITTGEYPVDMPPPYGSN